MKYILKYGGQKSLKGTGIFVTNICTVKYNDCKQKVI